MKATLLVACVLCVVYVATAATYYVKYDGSTSSSCGTTSSTACKYNNLNPIVNAVDAGDVIQFLGNTNAYPLTTLSGITVGTLSNPVRITGTGTTIFRAIRVQQSSNLKLDSLKIDGTGLADNHGIRIFQSGNITVHNTNIKKVDRVGIYAQEAPFLTLTNNFINTTQEKCIKVLRYDEGSTEYRGAIDLFSAGVIIQGNQMLNCGEDGIYISTQDAQIRRNKIYNIGIVTVDPPVHGIYSKSDNVWIDANIIHTTTHNGISVRSTSLVTNNTVWNNGLQRFPSQTHLTGSCYTFFNDGPHDGGIVSFENNVGYQPGPFGKTGINIMGNTYESEGYTFNILNNTIYYASDAIQIEDSSLGTHYIYNNKLVLSNSGTFILGSTQGTVSIANNYSQQNAGSATQIFVRPGTGDYRDYRLLSSINFTELPLSVYPRAAWTYGVHSTSFTSDPYPST